MALNSIFPKSVQPGIPRLGPLPKGWNTFLLGELVKEVSRPARLDDDAEYQQVTAKRSRGGIISRGAQRGKKIKTKTQFYVETGDFLISRRQIVHGGCGIVPEELRGAIVSNEYLVLHSNGNLLQDYLRWLSHSIYFQQTCFHASIGVHVEKMVFKPERWFGFKFHIPPKDEQERIVEIISTWNTTITHTERLIAAKTKSRNIILRQLYHSIRGNPKPLKKVAKIATGQSAPQDSTAFCDNGIPFIRVSCLEGLINGLPETAFEKITPRYAELNRINFFEKNTIIFSKSGMSAKLPRLYRLKNKCYLVSHLAAISPTAIEPAFLHYYLESNHPSQFTQGEGFPSIRTSEIAEMLIPVPDSSVQKKIGLLMDTITREIDLERVHLKLFKEQKRGLMQQLLTGQVRVGA